MGVPGRGCGNGHLAGRFGGALHPVSSCKVRILLPEKKHFRVGSHLYWELFSQSISMGLMSSIVSAGSVVLQYGINGLGTLVIAGHTAARKLFSFTDMPLMAMANRRSTFVSQNYGANQPERVRKGMREISLYRGGMAAWRCC